MRLTAASTSATLVALYVLDASPLIAAGFTLMDCIAFTNVLADERGLTNQIYMSGSGVAAGDADGDGRCDLFFCGIDSPNRFFWNLGDWQFGASAGVDQPSTGAVFAEVNGDGHLDLLLSGLGHGVRLFLNTGQRGFREATDESGLRSHSAAMTMALADIEGDGDLDLYVANYRSSTLQDQVGVPFRLAITNGRPVIKLINNRAPTAEELARYSVGLRNAIIENGEADVLYRNDGRGRFAPVSWTDGTFRDEHGQPLKSPPHDWSYTAMLRDISGDGAPDIYVCSDNTSPDRIWINDGKGRFQALPALALRHTSLASMGVDFADINRDGFDDIFVVDMMAREHSLRHRLMVERRASVPPGSLDERLQYMRNTLFLNRGDGTYAEIAQLSGLDASDWSWSPVFLDVDLDGYEDVLITTGLQRSLRDADARRQIDLRRAKGNLSQREFLELRRIMPRLETPNYAFRNRGDLTFEDMSERWGFDSRLVSQGMALADLDNDGDLDVAVNVLNGPALIYRNDCTNARVAVLLKGKPPNTRGIGARIKVVGAPVTQTQEMIAGGRYLSGDDAIRTFAAGNRIEVIWRSGFLTVISNVQPNRTYEVQEYGVPHSGADAQPAKAGSPYFVDVSHLLNDHTHVEQPLDDFERQPLLPREVNRIGPGVHWADLNHDGWDDLVIGSEGFINHKGTAFVRTNVSPGAKVAADVDADGQLEVFVAGRSLPGNYPEAAPSRIYSGRDLRTTFTNVGLVNGAVFTDLNHDGFPELIMACDWGPIRVFRNDKGKLSPWDMKLGALTGWWNSVTAGDFDNDGRMDLAAGNWGRNTAQSTQMFYGDLNGDGALEIIEANEDLRPRRPLDTLAKAMPWLLERFSTFAAFSEADVSSLLGERRSSMKHVSVNTVDSMIFLNRGDRFDVRALPIAAQFSPVFGLNVTDFDADGNEDLFLAQNFFGVDLESSCHDAGRGLMLRGDGRGNFSVVLDSGIAIYGEQRGSALADFDHDGRVDLAVSQYGSTTKLYRNQCPQRGLRIRLKGSAIGAVLRLGNGPAREIHAGSGHGSQDSFVQVLGRAQSAAPLRVRWPGGVTTTNHVSWTESDLEIIGP